MAAVVFTEREHLSDQSQTAIQGSRHTLPKWMLDKGPVRKITPISHLRGECPVRARTRTR